MRPRPPPRSEDARPRADEKPLIVLRDLVKRYGDKTVLDGLCLTIERGETLVVIGGSGSGKSTLARLVIGLERPTSGHIFVDGVDTTELGDRALTDVRRRFAMVFQSHALLDSLSVFDNVAFPLREETNLDEESVAERVMRALTELGVDHAADKLPAQLSGGMAKRVGIARAIVMQPEILVYDEPTSGLDPVTARSVDALIERMRDEHLVTSMVITHDMVSAYDLADRIVLLSGGKIVADGVPEAIFSSRHPRVLEFAESSGVDLARLGPRKRRKPPTEIRARWARAHPTRIEPRHGFFHRLRTAR